MPNFILPIPFALGPYGTNSANIFERILNVTAANGGMSEIFPSNLLNKYCKILPPIEFETLPDNEPQIGHFLHSAQSMMLSTSKVIAENFSLQDKLLVIGGDHTVSIGTGLSLSKLVDLSKVGLVWVDAHADCNTPETSLSKSLTGYPVAVNCGLGPAELTDKFAGNFIKKVVYIGLRDVDEGEAKNLDRMSVKAFSNLDIVEFGLNKVVEQSLKFLSDCEYLWLSIDIDSLDSIYFQTGETDVPVVGGLTPRELLFIAGEVAKTNKLLVGEIVQLNDVGRNTDLVVLASRLGELMLGLGDFRYGINL